MGADTLKGVYLPYLAPLWAVMLLDWVCFILLFNAKIKGRFFRVWLSGAGLRDFLCVLSFFRGFGGEFPAALPFFVQHVGNIDRFAGARQLIDTKGCAWCQKYRAFSLV